ncbi:MAG: hypothetical protein Kow0065_22300 [Methylomicrobium sp.]
MANTKFFIILYAFSGLLLTACAPVKPWERGILAKPHMALDPSPGESKIKQHVFFSKEATAGGTGVGGGGCGCN